MERRASLDGVRAVAVYLVVLFHAGLPGLAGGFIGVDSFFVLSGFLITNVLFHDAELFGRIRFGDFYAHCSTTQTGGSSRSRTTTSRPELRRVPSFTSGR